MENIGEETVVRTVPKPFSCAGCNKQGEGKFISLEGAKYHPGCLRCSLCSVVLSGTMSKYEGKICCVPCSEKKVTTTRIDGGRIGG